jgi:hypothetical protein
MKSLTLFCRKALEHCVTTLWLAIAICGAQVSLAGAADYSVVFEKSFLGGPSHPVVAHALIKTRDGGYAIAARIGATESWVVKTNSNGDKEWEQVIKATGSGEHLWQAAFLVLEAQDGGFLLGGDTNSRDLVGEWKGDMVPRPAFAEMEENLRTIRATYVEFLYMRSVNCRRICSDRPKNEGVA